MKMVDFCCLCNCCCKIAKCYIYTILSIIIAIALFIVISIEFGYRPLPSQIDFKSSGSFVGYPVWSSDDHDKIAGVEEHWREGILWPPLQGFIGPVNPRLTVFTQTGQDVSSRVDRVSLKDQASSLFYMSDYILVNRFEQPSEYRESLLVDITSNTDTTNKKMEDLIRTQELLSNAGLGMESGSHMAVPSRDGSVLASVAWNQTEVHVALMDVSSLQPILQPSIYHRYLPASTFLPFFFWDLESSTIDPHPTFVIAAFESQGNMMNAHVRLSSNGTIYSSQELINCVPYMTSSGRIRSDDGGFLTVNRVTNSIETSSLQNWHNCTSIY